MRKLHVLKTVVNTVSYTIRPDAISLTLRKKVNAEKKEN